ncbi:MAG: ferritin-like domain-containing protein [Planctomycetota bacterium]|jgi:rubrerythrin
MSLPFNADEVFEMAEQIERNGGEFYRAAAEKFPAVRDILLDLAAMEDEHLKTFTDMRAELSGTELEETVFDPDDQARMYLRAMADGHVFDTKADPAEKLADKDIPQEVLKMAIGGERDSIAFYVGLKEAVSRKAGKEKVEDIIKEEMGHIVILNQKLLDLT